MSEKQLLGPIIIRYIFFAINFFFTVQVVDVIGWNIFPVMLAAFASRDFVHASRLAQIYYQVSKKAKQ